MKQEAKQVQFMRVGEVVSLVDETCERFPLAASPVAIHRVHRDTGPSLVAELHVGSVELGIEIFFEWLCGRRDQIRLKLIHRGAKRRVHATRLAGAASLLSHALAAEFGSSEYVPAGGVFPQWVVPIPPEYVSRQMGVEAAQALVLRFHRVLWRAAQREILES
jgi:hypothetical protein